MTQSIQRPSCLQCRQMFTDEDVEAGNYTPVSFSMESGPSFVHKTCQTGGYVR